MNVKTFNLCSLVVKYDLEKAVYETYKINKSFLEKDERKVINQYIDDDNILEYVRDVLLEIDLKDETLELVDKTIEEVLKKNKDDSLLHSQIGELKNDFVTSLNENNFNTKCMFLKKSLIVR